jgi:tetratricopeptide (TPR) repeat protein
MCHHSFLAGRSIEACAFGQSAQDIAEGLGDFPLRVSANLYLGAASLAVGDYRQAVDCGQKILHWLEGDLSRQRFDQATYPAVYARWFLADSLAERGEFDEAIARGQEAVRIAEAVDHPYSLVVACLSLGYAYGVKGELGHAVRLLERGLAAAEDWNFALLSPVVSGFLGHVYALSDRIADGLSLLGEALKALESIGFALYHSLLVVHLGEACTLAVRLEEALASAKRALALSRERGQRGWEAYALGLLGEITSHLDPLDVGRAEGHYRQALALAEELGMRPLIAHCNLGLGTRYRRTGDHAKAHEHLTNATTMYREMGMGFWLERAEAELGSLA